MERIKIRLVVGMWSIKCTNHRHPYHNWRFTLPEAMDAALSHAHWDHS